MSTRCAVLGVVMLAGCGYATQTDMQGQLEQLRSDVEAGDAAVGQRVSALGTRLDDNDRRLVALERDLQTLREQYDVRIERLEGRMEGLLAFNVPVHFEFDRTEVRAADHPVLDRFAAVVKQYYPSSMVTVEGFTDPVGSDAYNLQLGKARAEAVKAYLVGQGVGAEQLRTVSYGEATDRLVTPNAGGANAGVLNRRVVIVVDRFAGAGTTD